nr:hypothetical protein [Tanacetum cinerariifolium]
LGRLPQGWGVRGSASYIDRSHAPRGNAANDAPRRWDAEHSARHSHMEHRDDQNVGTSRTCGSQLADECSASFTLDVPDTPHAIESQCPCGRSTLLPSLFHESRQFAGIAPRVSCARHLGLTRRRPRSSFDERVLLIPVSL